jgi:hypothetical protein
MSRWLPNSSREAAARESPARKCWLRVRNLGSPGGTAEDDRAASSEVEERRLSAASKARKKWNRVPEGRHRVFALFRRRDQLAQTFSGIASNYFISSVTLVKEAISKSLYPFPQAWILESAETKRFQSGTH